MNHDASPSEGVLHDGAQSPLPLILSRLSHLDLSSHILGKELAQEAHGGFGDIFVGHLPSECLHKRRIDRLKEGKVKVALKRLRVRLDKHAQLAKVR